MDLSTLGKEPVSPGEPAGGDVRYSPLFDQLQAEVDRMSLPAVAGEVDWEKVVQLAAGILREQSKDLLVAGYLAVGLIQTRQVEGLALALKLYGDLIEQHGPLLFPERERARQRAVEWLLEKAETALRPLEGSAIAAADLTAMRDDLARLEQLLAGLLQLPPSLQLLRDFLASASGPDEGSGASRWDPAASDEAAPGGQSAASAGAPAADPLPQDAAVSPLPLAPSGPAAASGAPPGEPPQSPGQAGLKVPAGARQALEEALQRLRQAAELLREVDLRNPTSYRLSRQAVWSVVSELPPAAAGRTRLASPSPDLCRRLEALMSKGDWSALIGELEAQLNQHIFWLDLNRRVAEALAGVDGAEAAAAAVYQETSSLVRRLPGLDELAFADGTRFADAATRRWLQQQAHVGRARANSLPLHDPLAFGNDGMEAEERLAAGKVEEALGAVGDGKLMEAIRLFQARSRNCASGRERLQWLIALSRILLKSGEARLALPHLEQVLTEVDSYDLERYDPEAALQALKLVWRAFQAQDDPFFRKKAGEILHRIARIDLVEMVHLTDERTGETPEPERRQI